MDLKNFISATAQIAEEKGIPLEKVIESIETALAAAYKKDYGKKGQIVKAKLNMTTGQAKFWQIKIVVEESMIYSEEELEKIPEKTEMTNTYDIHPLGTTLENLRNAEAGENYEWGTMYPNFEQEAREEGENEIADFFR